MDWRDNDDNTWNPVFVSKHREVKKPHQRVILKVGWLHHEPTWEDAPAVQLQNPFIVMDYARRNHLLQYPDFSWVATVSDNTFDNLRSVCAVKKDGPKYKFGELVPNNVAHAFAIDRKNNNTAWQDAIATELKQIND
jgi:hypothetical protein